MLVTSTCIVNHTHNLAELIIIELDRFRIRCYTCIFVLTFLKLLTCHSVGFALNFSTLYKSCSWLGVIHVVLVLKTDGIDSNLVVYSWSLVVRFE